MIRASAALHLLVLAAAPPAFAQSHAGHLSTPQAGQAAPPRAGCVRRGAPTADAARLGQPGAPACPTGYVPERSPAADPHAGHDMGAPGQPQVAPASDPHTGHAMPETPAPSADPHAGHDMGAPAQPQAAPPSDPHAGHAMPETPAPSADPHAGHDMGAPARPQAAPPSDPHADHPMPGTPAPVAADPHAGHDMAGMAMPPDVPTSADTPGRPPEDPAPPAASRGPAHAADLLFDPAEMAAAREQMRAENGDVRTTAVVFDRLEANLGDGEEGFAWDAQGWSGGDISRFWWKSEGEGEFGEGVEEAGVQALYSRAVAPFWDVQAGLRQTWRPVANRTDLVIGVQGLAPYWFEVDAALFLSNKGELTAAAEGEYDQRITNRWILQPRAEVNLSAEDIPELSIGAGLTSVQLGARLRYEIRKEFAPYVGVEWTKRFGRTADYLEAAGRNTEDTRIVVGLRAWF